MLLLYATFAIFLTQTLSQNHLIYTYNSSDLSYLSNGIQFPVSRDDIEDSKGDSKEEDLSQIQWFSQLYDHHKWYRRVDKLMDLPLCKKDMLMYLKKLKNGTSWAVKMFDSSGRYPTQFLFGNDYWLGSKTHCEEIQNSMTNPEIPPFKLQFFVAKVRININQNITPVTRQLNVGECLPESCGIKGVKLMLAQESNLGNSVSIVGVRKVPGNYTIFYDEKFYYTFGSSLIVGMIILIATIVDITARKKGVEDVENNNNNETKRGGKETNVSLQILLAFSAIKNGKKILSFEKISLESIKCLHGLRFFSISWIILVHTYLEIFAIADNKHVRILTERNFTYQTISNATFSVDTFFFISGLLITLTYFRANKDKQIRNDSIFETIWRSSLKFLLLILYRFLRLTPAYLFVLGFNEIVMRYLHSISVFSPAIIDHISCAKFWWRNLLYINNFYPQNEFCMLWSWYIANDTQFYVIATILLVIAIRGKKQVRLALISIILLLIASWTTTFVLAMKYDYVARVEEPFALFDQLYDKPWMRIGPYLIGMIVGYFLYITNCNVKIRTLVNMSGWGAALGCLGCLVYGLGRKGLVVPTSAFYVSLGHTAWGLALGWITVACSSGNGGIINSLLSCKLFLPLSRLTYCAYLIHPVLMCLTSFHLDGSLHLHLSMAIVIFLGNVVLSFLCAFVISLTFEAPIVNILKIIF